jgi:DNA replication ATP-dependent helicase Dna2
MQGCLKEGEWASAWIDERIARVVRAGDGGRRLGDLVKLGVSVEEAIREVTGRAAGLKVFGERYMAQTPKVPSNWFLYIFGHRLTNQIYS